jgi:hypothetical protein
MAPPREIREGMVVKSRDGEPLGRVIAVDEEGFVLERKVVLSRELRLEHEDVHALEGGSVVLNEDRASLRGLEVPVEVVWSTRQARAGQRPVEAREEVGIPHRRVVVVEHAEARTVEVERGPVPTPRYVPLGEPAPERGTGEEQEDEEERPYTLH